jgi:predicted nucleic acid-binding protein
VTVPFADTSALAKWYLNEEQSDRFASFMVRAGGAAISRLTVAEMRSLLNRRLRAKDFSSRVHRDIVHAFERDIQLRYLEVYPLEDLQAQRAIAILHEVPGIPIRTLDALQLATALELKADLVATADRVMARAGRKLGLQVATFF